jgi:hypothetical protein
LINVRAVDRFTPSEVKKMASAKVPLIGGVVLAAMVLPAVPAAADDTTATFIVTAGLLDISVPVTANLGSVVPGDLLDEALGVVTVTDERASDDASWTATVYSTDFTTDDGATAAEVILVTDVDYWSGTATSTSGNGTFTPGQPGYANKQPLSSDPLTPLTAFSHVGGTGNNTASWSAALSIPIPLDSVAGTYTATVTHSVG